MVFFIRLIGVLAFTCVIVSIAHSSAPQDSTGSGFQLKIIRQDAKDTVSTAFISFDEIKSLPIQSVELPDHKTKEPITWEGVYLKEVFQQFLNIAWEKIDRLVIKAPDGYSSVVSGLRMKDAESGLCTFAMQNKEWPKKFGYMRIIFPDLHEMHWMNNPSEVELILKSDSNEKRAWKFFFFDSPVFHSFQNKKAEETAEWSVNDILTALDCANQGFAIFTSDGQVREYLFDEIAERMKLASDSTGWLKIRGERVPIGFRLRKIFFFYSENVGLFTKSLTTEEQLLWQEMFASIQPLVNRGIAADEISLVLASGEKIPSPNFGAYRAGEISFYQLLQREKETQADLLAIEVNW